MKLDKQIVVLNDDLREEPFAAEFVKKFKKCGIDYRVKTCKCEDDHIKYGQDADIIFNQGATKITRKIIENLPNLKVIIRRGAGYDNVDVEAAREKGIIVCNTPGFCAEEVATQAIALLLAFIRRIPYWHNWTRAGKWNKGEYSFMVEPPFAGLDTLEGEDVGIVGFGFIGKNIYKKLIGFDVNFYVYDKYIKVDRSYNVKQVELEELLKNCRYIILCCPLTSETKYMIDDAQLKIMRNDAVIVNVGRGALINEAVLIKYLQEKKIAGAALDVFEETPVNKDSMLLKLDNVVISPHNGGM
ncbi:MAG: C-terminal binding protein, partial [Actinobacteria bacterium]|nr:C-terminal binding protein [Actinomycetota bacterium]